MKSFKEIAANLTEADHHEAKLANFLQIRRNKKFLKKRGVLKVENVR